ncbi:MAG TPA: class I SAM-dependent methyltransferase [Allosphingosinicella sp.]|jgi:2-polyprenyl-3-methyl-5-hydroxy-6-metoxy-1,4-benzoquinol methylase
MFRSRAAAIACPTGVLNMVRCMACGFAWNSAFDPALLTYDADYENDQTLSPAYRRHLEGVADVAESMLGGRGGITALEVGLGQGQFLAVLAGRLGERIERLIGFDPAFRPSSPLPPRAHVERTLFSEATRAKLEAAPDLVVTRHVIEHVADPVAFLRSIRAACAEGVPIVVETPNLEWILRGAVVHDLYYEHCSLFDPDSLRRALAAAGFVAEAVHETFGGQYLIAAARAAASPVQEREAPSPVDNARYPERKAASLAAVTAALERDKAAGERVALWGGASKGVTLALLLGERRDPVELAIDVNPARAGTFMPVTGLPVVLPEAAREAGITKAYVMNPLYFGEIERDCRAAGWPIELVAIDRL